MPPTSWLRASRALSTRPTPYAATMRGIRISPRSASTRASTNTAPNECIEYFPCSAPGAARAVASTARPPFFATIARQLSTSSAEPPSDAIRSPSASAAACTAGPVLAAVIEPAEIGFSGYSVSPSSKRIRSTGTPSASAAIWLIDV